jgi:uncharacterized membrane protein YidH (DUF202 family)
MAGTSRDPRSAPPSNDPGLAGERTALAWQRSALSLALVGALTLRAAVESGVNAPILVAAVALLFIGAVPWAHGLRSYREARYQTGVGRRRRAPIVLMTAVTLAAALVALLIAVART